MSQSRRRFLAGSCAAIALLAAEQSVRAALSGIVPSSAAPPGTLLSTMTLVNNGVGSMAANTIGTPFLLAFKIRDIPAGTAPVIKAGGVVQPYSWGLQAYWSDGSVRTASIFPRWTFSLGASGTQAIQIYNGGSAPSASSRTLTEVYSQAVQINVTGANNSGTGITYANLIGAWSAWLDSAANTNNNNWQQSVLWDGDAGKGWEVRCHMSSTKTGSAHGQLEGRFFIFAGTDSGGALGGFRILPIIETPWYNSPTNTNGIFAFQAAVSWQYGAGPTTVDMVSTGTFPFVNMPFTCTAGACTTNSSNNIYQGANSVGNSILCYLTGAGLPTGLSTNTLYAVQSNQYGGANNNITFFDVSAGSQGSVPAITPSGNGTGTIVPLNGLMPLSRLPMPTTGGRWNEFQGTGSGNIGSAVNLQMQLDQTYSHATKVFPPYDKSLIGTITDNTWNYTWTPFNIGPWMWGQSSGERPELAPIPNEHAVHWYTQSAFSDTLVRVTGYAGNISLCNARDLSTGNLPNLDNNTYTGMPAWQGTTTNIFIWTGTVGEQNGLTVPSNWINLVEPNTSHQPGPCAYPYLLTGEPQYLLPLIEMAIMSIAQPPQTSTANNYGRNPTTPYSAYGLITQFSNEVRLMAWANRNLQLAAALCPKPFYDGSQLWNNLDALATANSKFPNDMLNPSNNIYGSATTWRCTNAMWAPASADVGNMINVMGVYHLGYFMWAMLIAASAREDANALAFVQKIVGTRLPYLSTNGGGNAWIDCGYYENTCLESTASQIGAISDSVADLAHYGITCNIGTPGPFSSFSWASSGATRFSFTGTNQSGSGYIPTNNDQFIFQGPQTMPTATGSALYTPYYLGDVSGNNCNLYTAINGGGTKLLPSNSGSFVPNQTYLVPQAPPAASSGDQPQFGPPDAQAFTSIWAGVINWAIALGVTGASGVQTDVTTRLANSTAYAASIAAIPKNAMQATF